MRILLIGAGAIGSTVARAADGMADVERVLVLDERAEAAAVVAAECAKSVVAEGFESALHASDLVVEAASQAAVARFGPHALRAGRDLIAVSVGALENDALREELERSAREGGRRLYVPSGALVGLDGVRAAREATLSRVELTTAKPPAGFGREHGAVVGPQTLYDGPARDAVKAFPKNVNVAAALSLAGVGFERTRVRVVADPSLDRNTHSVEVEGEFGFLRIEVRNAPFPRNPATSYLAALSVVALVRKLASPIQVGT